VPYLLRYDGEQPAHNNTIIIDRVLPCYAHDAYIGAYPRRGHEYVHPADRSYLQTYKSFYQAVTNPAFTKRYIPIHSSIHWSTCINPWGLHLIEIASGIPQIVLDYPLRRINLQFELRNYDTQKFEISMPLHDIRFDPWTGYHTTWTAVDPVATGTKHQITYLTGIFAPTLTLVLGGRSPSESYSRTIVNISTHIALSVSYTIKDGLVQGFDGNPRLIRSVDDFTVVKSIFPTFKFLFEFSGVSCKWIVKYSPPVQEDSGSGDPNGGDYIRPVMIPYDRIEYRLAERFEGGDLPEVPDNIISFDKDELDGRPLSTSGDRYVTILSIYNLVKDVSYYKKAMDELDYAMKLTNSTFWSTAFTEDGLLWVQSGNTLASSTFPSSYDVSKLDAILPFIGVAFKVDDINGFKFITRIHLFTRTTTGYGHTDPLKISRNLQGSDWIIPTSITLQPNGSLLIKGYEVSHGELRQADLVCNPMNHTVNQMERVDSPLQATSIYNMVKMVNVAVSDYLQNDVPKIPQHIINDLKSTMKTIAATSRCDAKRAEIHAERTQYQLSQDKGYVSKTTRHGSGDVTSEPPPVVGPATEVEPPTEGIETGTKDDEPH